jgi:CPA1 family monovalent cation:H+ antiporter
MAAGVPRGEGHSLAVFVTVAVVAALLAAAFLFARVAQYSGFPPAASIVLVGIAAGGMLPHTLQIALTPGVLALFLPALIFEAAWDLDARELRRAALAIVVLAVPGVAVTALVIAAGGMLGGLAVPAACALGAILCATDPVAVIALFRSLDVPLDLLTIVEGESIANDGVAIVLLQAVTNVVARPRAIPYGALLGHAAYVMVAGSVLGVAVAFVATPLLRRGGAGWFAIAVTLVVAYGAYGLAALAGASGIFASAAAGVALPTLSFAVAEQRAVERFWDGTALVANGVVFLLVGLSLQFDRIFHEPLLLVATIASVVLARLLLAYVLVPLRGTRAALIGRRHAIALAGVRGGLSLALALGLPVDFPNRAAIVDAVFAVVFGTVVLQGWALAPLLRRISLPGR